MMVDIFWGIRELDTEGSSHWDPEFIGKAVMDDSFDLSTEEAQNSILSFCKDLRKQEFVKNENVKCWLEDFQTWVKSTKGKDMPLSKTDFDAYLKEYRNTPTGKQLESD